jgi:hypothetical protein
MHVKKYWAIKSSKDDAEHSMANDRRWKFNKVIARG